MQPVNHMRSFTSILMILFLLASIVCSSYTLHLLSQDKKTETSLTNEETVTSLLVQILFEEKEEKSRVGKERKDGEPSQQLFLLGPVCNPAVHNTLATGYPADWHSPCKRKTTHRLPLYLSKRTLLI